MSQETAQCGHAQTTRLVQKIEDLFWNRSIVIGRAQAVLNDDGRLKVLDRFDAALKDDPGTRFMIGTEYGGRSILGYYLALVPSTVQ
jgi:hypothetical protein